MEIDFFFLSFFVCFQTEREKKEEKKKKNIVWFYNWPYLLLHAELINPSACWSIMWKILWTEQQLFEGLGCIVN